MIVPSVVNGAPIFIPLPPPDPPMQLVKVTALLPVNAAPKFTPWLAPIGPPVPVSVIVLVVRGLQEFISTKIPCAPIAVARLVPARAIVPEELVIPVELAR